MEIIDPNRKRKYIKQGRVQFLRGESLEDWNPELIKEQIIKFHSLYKPFTIKLFRLYRIPTPDPILSKVIGKPSSRKFFHYAACYYFGSWVEAMKSCDLQPTRMSHNKFWNKSLIILSIKSLHSSDHPLTVKTIWRDRKRSTTNILRLVTGKATTGSGLHDAARRYFGSWDLALKSSGIEPESIKEKPFWTKAKIVKAIQAARASEVALNAQRIGKDCTTLTSKIIGKSIGKRRLGRSLYGGAYRIFGSWDRKISG